jgi:cyclopropane-fatty-acyl-phospholipid synthase
MRAPLLSALGRAAAAHPQAAFEVRLPGEAPVRFGAGAPQFTITFATQAAVRATLLNGFLGFGEAYMSGSVEVEGDWDRLFALAMGTSLERTRPSGLAAIAYALQRLRRRDSRAGARRNIAQHYDLGNDFYRLWLDRGMSYSCAYFAVPGMTLDEAQVAKLELICRKLRLAPGLTLLDVGCGWGALLIHAAARHGVRGVGCTLSPNQVELGRQRVREAGLQERVEIRLADYRDIEGPFDRWVSVGMAEHVGRPFLAGFSGCLARQLRPQGVGLLHSIGKDRVSRGDPWTLTYIFPGGYIPALPELAHHLGRHDMTIVDVENLRPHYALTLDRWQERFEAHVAEIEAMYDDRFVRMWRLFLVSSAAGFRYSDTRLFQIVFTHGPSGEIPLTRADVYA